MKAIVQHAYGSPDRLELQEVARPPLDPDGVLVRVRAASVNPLDWHVMRGHPYFVRLTDGLRRPKQPIRGVDFAGDVEAVGGNVTGFMPGEAVFGTRGGALAEYVCARPKHILGKPA